MKIITVSDGRSMLSYATDFTLLEFLNWAILNIAGNCGIVHSFDINQQEFARWIAEGKGSITRAQHRDARTRNGH